MPNYDEEIDIHLPKIHDDTYTWETFSKILKGEEEETYEEDKIYFIEDVTSEKDLLRRLTQELLNAKQQLEEIIESFPNQQNNG